MGLLGLFRIAEGLLALRRRSGRCLGSAVGDRGKRRDWFRPGGPPLDPLGHLGSVQGLRVDDRGKLVRGL